MERLTKPLGEDNGEEITGLTIETDGGRTIHFTDRNKDKENFHWDIAFENVSVED